MSLDHRELTPIGRVERVLLGTMLLDTEAFKQADELNPSDLSLDAHRLILTTMRTMHAKGLGVDPITLQAEMERLKIANNVGGVGYVMDLTSDTWKGHDVSDQIRLVKADAARRSIYATCAEAQRRVQDGEEPEAITSALQEALSDAQRTALVAKAVHISELVLPTWEAMREQMDRPDGTLLGIPTGIAELDESMQGWQAGELTYVGGLPGRGKTSFFVQCMYNAAMGGFGVGCISLEMRAGQLVRRLGTLHSSIGPRRFRDPKLMSSSERARAKDALFSLADLPMWVCDHSGLSPGSITALARWMRDKGAKVIFVDFIQIIREDGRDRREAIDRISAALRDLAKSMGIPFVVASQLARKGDQEREPKLQDLKESGSLEQDAHNVIFVHRPMEKTSGPAMTKSSLPSRGKAWWVRFLSPMTKTP